MAQTEKRPRKKKEPVVCPYIAFSMADGSPAPTVHRSQIKNAPYNPRRIKESAAERLRANLKTVGLTHPLTWNKRTSHLLAGHQRIAVIDSLMRTDDYLLPVVVVDLDESQEKSQNVFENNPDAQGHFDPTLFQELIKDPGFDLEAAGVELAAVIDAFGVDSLAGRDEDLAKIADALRESQEAYAKLKDRAAKRDQADYYRVYVFASADEARAFDRLLGQDEGEVFQDGRSLQKRLEVSICR